MKKQILFIVMIIFCFLFHQVKAQNSFIKIEGEANSMTIHATDLQKMKRAEATMKDRDGKIYHYSGVPVFEILKQAGVTLGKDLRGENLSKYVLVKAADGYEVLFSLTEFDSSFTDRVIILADQLEGKPLPSGKGPFRMVVPVEKKTARCIFEVTSIIVRYAKE